MEAHWLVLDPLRSGDSLFCQNDKAVWSLDGIQVKEATRHAMLHMQPMRHRPSEIAEMILYTDGGGPRVSKGVARPATWAVVVLTKGWHGSVAFDRAIGGQVVTDPGADGYIGAEDGTSTTAEVTAQVHAIVFALADPLSTGVLPVSIVFDNTTAANFAMSVAQVSVMSTWAVHYSPEKVKLQYLLFLPRNIQHVGQHHRF